VIAPVALIPIVKSCPPPSEVTESLHTVKSRAETRYCLRLCPLFYLPPGDSSFNIPVNPFDIGKVYVFTALRRASQGDSMALIFR